MEPRDDPEARELEYVRPRLVLDEERDGTVTSNHPDPPAWTPFNWPAYDPALADGNWPHENEWTIRYVCISSCGQAGNSQRVYSQNLLRPVSNTTPIHIFAISMITLLFLFLILMFAPTMRDRIINTSFRLRRVVHVAHRRRRHSDTAYNTNPNRNAHRHRLTNGHNPGGTAARDNHRGASRRPTSDAAEGENWPTDSHIDPNANVIPASNSYHFDPDVLEHFPSLGVPVNTRQHFDGVEH